MGENGLTVADALALRNSGNGNNGNDMFGGNQAWWIIIIILFFAFAGFGRNGFGGNSGNDSNGTNTVVVPMNTGSFGFGGYNACCTPATQQGVSDLFNFNQLDNGIRGLERGMCDGFYTTNLGVTNLGTQMQQGFCSSDRANLQSFNSVQSTLCQGFNGVNNSISQLGYNMKDCCCGLEKIAMQGEYNSQANFNSLGNQLASCCCDLKTGQANIAAALDRAVCDITQNQDRQTDRVINYLTQTEMDKLRAQLQDARGEISQARQTQDIVSQLLPVAKPAYLTCSPYAAAMGYGYGFQPVNSNCNCNNNFGCC